MTGDAREYVIAGIGEVLWDVLGESEELGGAPVNFAYHAGVMGGCAYAISCVGDDARGRRALAELEQRGVSVAHIVTLPGAVTGYVQATVDKNGVASYEFPDDVAWDRLEIREQTAKLAGELDAVCFGSLAQRSEKSREAIIGFLKKLDASVLKVFDLNIRQDFYTKEVIHGSLESADVLKLNDDEILLLKKLLGLEGNETVMMEELVRRFSLKLGVLTRGGQGSLLVSENGVSNHPGYPSQVVDTIGAGDSFTAAAVLGMLRGESLDRINEQANRIAGYVCSCRGAMPPLPPELIPYG